MKFERKTATVAGNATKVWTVPDGEIWHIVHMHVSYVGDATAANRFPTFITEDSSSIQLSKYSVGVATTANLTIAFEWIPGTPRETGVVETSAICAIPRDFMITPEDTLTYSVRNGVAGDSGVVYLDVKVYPNSHQF